MKYVCCSPQCDNKTYYRGYLCYTHHDELKCELRNRPYQGQCPGPCQYCNTDSVMNHEKELQRLYGYIPGAGLIVKYQCNTCNNTDNPNIHFATPSFTRDGDVQTLTYKGYCVWCMHNRNKLESFIKTRCYKSKLNCAVNNVLPQDLINICMGFI